MKCLGCLAVAAQAARGKQGRVEEGEIIWVGYALGEEPPGHFFCPFLSLGTSIRVAEMRTLSEGEACDSASESGMTYQAVLTSTVRLPAVLSSPSPPPARQTP